MKIKKTIISIAIALILALFVGYGIEVFDPTIDYYEFCPKVYDITNQAECEETGGRWAQEREIDWEVERPPRVVKVETDEAEEPENHCFEPANCRERYQDERNRHDKIIFIAAVIVGLISIMGGILIKKEVAGIGIVGGGVLLILYGTIRYWQHANDILKFILLGIALAVLIWIAYQKLEKR